MLCDADGVLYDLLDIPTRSGALSTYSLEAWQIMRDAKRRGYHSPANGQQQLPLTLVLDKDGTVLFSHYGASLTDVPADCGAAQSLLEDLDVAKPVDVDDADVTIYADPGAAPDIPGLTPHVHEYAQPNLGETGIAVLRTMGIENIVAVDGEQKRLDFAKRMGAEKSVNFKDFQGIDALAQGVKDAFGGHAADFAFQCTGSPIAHANIYKFIRNGGGLCELGFFINGGDATINPHFDLCSKEITLVGSWVYTLRDYATTFDFLKRAKAIGLPMDDLITHEFPLEQINEAHQTNLAMKGLKIAIINK